MEAGIECQELTLRGTINWTNFGPKGEDWLGFIFLITQFTGETYETQCRGAVGVDRYFTDLFPTNVGRRPPFFALVFDEDPRAFYGHMPYEGSKPISGRS